MVGEEVAQQYQERHDVVGNAQNKDSWMVELWVLDEGSGTEETVNTFRRGVSVISTWGVRLLVFRTIY